MIQANELRIGNWVLHMGEMVQIDAIDSDESLNILADSTGNIASRCDIAHPVPLTPELLEHCGFKLSQSLGGYYLFLFDSDCTFLWTPKGLELHIDNETELKILSAKQESKILYLHQLQNLYFALTGQELTIKDLA
jgi:hypothetical protein